MISRTLVSILLLIALCSGGVADAAEHEHPIAVGNAEKAADRWLNLIENKKYKQSWEAAPEVFRNHVSPDAWAKKVSSTREPMGALLSRTFKSGSYETNPPGAPPGNWVVLEYDSSFENKKDATETLTLMEDKGGAWQVAGYFIK